MQVGRWNLERWPELRNGGWSTRNGRTSRGRGTGRHPGVSGDGEHRAAKVTLEHNVRDVLKAAHGAKGRPADSLPKQGRFDIVVWNAWGPNGVIEVKTRGYSTLLRDVRRVCAAVSNAERIRWGLVAYVYALEDRAWTRTTA